MLWAKSPPSRACHLEICIRFQAVEQKRLLSFPPLRENCWVRRDLPLWRIAVHLAACFGERHMSYPNIWWLTKNTIIVIGYKLSSLIWGSTIEISVPNSLNSIRDVGDKSELCQIGFSFIHLHENHPHRILLLIWIPFSVYHILYATSNNGNYCWCCFLARYNNALMNGFLF